MASIHPSGDPPPRIGDKLLRAVYGVSYETSGWSQVIDQLTLDRDAGGTCRSVSDWSAADLAEAHTTQTRSEWTRAYRDMAMATDSWLDALPQYVSRGKVYSGADLVTLHREGECSFSAPFVSRFDRFHALDGVLECDATTRASVSVCRESTRAVFSPDAVAYFQAVLPDIRRAMHRQRAMAPWNGRVERLEAVLDRVRVRVIILDHDTRVLHASVSERALLDRNPGLRVVGNCLQTASLLGTRQLQSFVREVATRRCAQPRNRRRGMLLDGLATHAPLQV